MVYRCIAVLKDWSRKGIGTRLMHSAEQQSRQHYYRKIALHVDQGNTQALELCAQLRYVITQQTYLYQRPHLRMVKSVVL